MPLFTNDISEARRAYAALEARTASVELHASRIDAALRATQARDVAADVGLLRQRIADLEGDNIKLRNQLDDLRRARSDASLQQFIEAIALSAALGEATMPDRLVVSLSASIKAHLMLENSNVALRFQPPELGASGAALGTTSFEIAKVPPPPGAAAPANFYLLLMATQNAFGHVLVSDNFPELQALQKQMVVETTRALMEVGQWNFAYLVDLAEKLASIETEYGKETGDQGTALHDAAAILVKLAQSLSIKSNPVAADLYALTAAFAEATRTATALLRPLPP